MDNTNNKALEKIKILIEKLRKQNIIIEIAYLFGSYAKGNYNELSDIDVALVSKDFVGIRFLDKEKIARYVIETDISLEPITFRPEDFTIDNPIVSEIKKTGILIR